MANLPPASLTLGASLPPV
jgi:hypothetical protein